MEKQPGEFWLEGLYLGWIEDDVDEIKLTNLENKLFQEIREKKANDPEIVVMCREILFLNTRIIERLTERIEDVKARIKAISKRQTEEPGGV